MGVCDLWPVAEPSQNKRKRSIGKLKIQQIERSIGPWMDGCVDACVGE